MDLAAHRSTGAGALVGLLFLLLAGIAEARLPPVLANGYLPPGMHRTDFGAFSKRYGATDRRQTLLRDLRSALVGIRRAGFSRVYVGGSFVGPKPEPSDVDVLVPRQREVDWERLVRVARRAFPAQLHFYGARKIVTDALNKQITPAQRSAWQLRKPDFVEFFSQNRAGEQVGIVAIDLATVPTRWDVN
jgi:hypothetical protein